MMMFQARELGQNSVEFLILLLKIRTVKMRTLLHDFPSVDLNQALLLSCA